MNFKETLEKCWRNNISIAKASVASEVDCLFNDGEGHLRNDFERLCGLAYETYLNVDNNICVSWVVEALKYLVIDSKKNVNKIVYQDVKECLAHLLSKGELV